jgi:3-oxoadipate enol-lactonase
MQTKEKTVSVNGIDLAYDDSGSGETPVIFLHGFPFNRHIWDPQVNGLTDSFRVISYDMRGYGYSGKGESEFSIDLFASDLLGLMDALQIKRAVGCGLSMGGYVLMNAASRNPARFAGLVLADTQCIADSDENKANRSKGIETVKTKGVVAFVEGMLPKLFAAASVENRLPGVERVKSMMMEASADSIASTLRALAERQETCNALKSLDIPALILCGKEDGITPMSQSELMNNALKGSEMHVIPDTGHLANIEEPEKFNGYLRDFLKKVIG